jgi:hypothetical protein
MIMNKTYVQYGCGTDAIQGWMNFDASLTLRLQRIPMIGRILKTHLNCIFDAEVRYGDIVCGLPVPSNYADGVFCSHVLEHLSLDDFHKALENTFLLLKRGGGISLYCSGFRTVCAGIYFHDFRGV